MRIFFKNWCVNRLSQFLFHVFMQFIMEEICTVLGSFVKSVRFENNLETFTNRRP